jgi:glyoxylate reductase
MSARVYITQPLPAPAIERLRTVASVRWNPDPLHVPSKEELIAEVRGCDILYCLLHDRVDRDVIAANPGLRAIVSTTITPADIDVVAATERGIPVTVIPAALLNDATADLAWALLLCVARRVAEGDRLLRSGVFPGSQSSYMEAGGVSGRRLGLIGMGGVGRAVARRARGFAMELWYFDPHRLAAAEEHELGLRWVELAMLLREADFVSLHARLTPENRHMIGAAELGLMKRGAYLINTARGPLVDEQALVDALTERRIAGAALDVFENEPQPHPELLRLPNVVMTPHVGSAVTEVRTAMAGIAVDNICAILAGHRAPNCWNAEIYRDS